MSKYKMITCDLDGTLFGTNDHVSDENNAAIKEFKKLGIPFVPCTGRTLQEMKEVKDNPDIRYIIYSSGAMVLDKEVGNIIDFGIPDDKKKKLFDIVYKYDIFSFLHADGNCYVDSSLRDKEREYNLTDTLYGLARNVALPLEDFNKNALNMKIESLCIMFKDSDEQKMCKEELIADGNFSITEPWPANLEISSVKAGKANAIEALAEKFGISLNDVISLGDSDNDLGALKVAGLGIATSNGSDAIKKIADEVGCSNDEHIAKYVLNKYF